jgi:geranylgeranyl diphosphate synthase type I
VGGDPAVARALDEYGRALGMAFQLVDDLLGIWGDPAVTGKSVLSDLRARKRSLPVTYALNQDQVATRRLAGWLAGTSTEDEAGLREIADLIEATGARSWANGQAARHIRQAEQALAASSIAPSLQAEFRTVARFVAEREY